MAKKVYRFAALGTETFVGGIKMNRFGQRFQIEEKLAIAAQRGGAVLLEETEFNQFGFSDQDLKVWASPFMSQHDVPGDLKDAKSKAEFLKKVQSAQSRYIEIQQGLLEPHERTLADNFDVAVPELEPITEEQEVMADTISAEEQQ